MTHLIVTHENQDVDEFRFDADHSPISVGRRSSNDVCIASPSVSGNHARILLDTDGVWIEDLNSTNGTFINGRLISRRRLERGDEITIGKARITWLGWAGAGESQDEADHDSRADDRTGPVDSLQVSRLPTDQADADDASAVPADQSTDDATPDRREQAAEHHIGETAEGRQQTDTPVDADPLKPYADRLSGRREPAPLAGDPVAPRRRFDDLLDKETQHDHDDSEPAGDLRERSAAAVHKPSSASDQDASVVERSSTVARSAAATAVAAGLSRSEADASATATADAPAGQSTTSAPVAAADARVDSEASTAGISDEPDDDPAADAHPLDDIQDVAVDRQTVEDALFEVTLGKAALEIRNGAKSGQTLLIDKPVTTLGRPGIQIAAIMRKPDGYFLMHVESDENAERPTLNDDTIGDDPVPLRSGDELRVAGVDVQFTLS